VRKELKELTERVKMLENELRQKEEGDRG